MSYSVVPSTSLVINTSELQSVAVADQKSFPYATVKSSCEKPQTTSTEATLEAGGLLQTEEKASDSVLRRIVNCVKENPKTAMGVVGIGLAGCALGYAYAASLATSTSLCKGGQLFLVEGDGVNTIDPFTLKAERTLPRSDRTVVVDLLKFQNQSNTKSECYHKTDYQLNPNIKLFGNASDASEKIGFERKKGAIKVSVDKGTNKISFEDTCNIPSDFEPCSVSATPKDDLKKNGFIMF